METTEYVYREVVVHPDEKIEIPDNAIGVTTVYNHNELHGEEVIVRYLRPTAN